MNHIKSIVAAFAFSWLFYNKSFGLNLVLLSIMVITVLSTVRNKKSFSWMYAIPYFFTAVMVFIDTSSFHIFVHFLALTVFIGKSMASKTSLYMASFTGTINFFVGFLVNLVDAQNGPKQERKNLSPQVANYIKGAFLSVGLIVIFVSLYRNANPIFENLIASIDLSFVSIQWVFFTLLGYLLFLNLLEPYRPSELWQFDATRGNTLPSPKMPFSKGDRNRMEKEHIMGSMVLGALNLLLVLFLSTDILYLFQSDVGNNADYSNSVHRGIYALVLSILIAIAIILYFFRGNLNFYEGNRRLKQLTYVWIVLNLALVFSTFYKNWVYVEALGLTYKRIGVFAYLLLTLAGLTTAYFKVSQIKNFMYLLRTNFAILFAFLVLGTTVPWDRTITWYNLNYLDRPDIAYLLRLSDSNLPQLIDYSKTHRSQLVLEQEVAINDRYQEFLEEEEQKTWQELTLYQLVQNDTP